MQRDKKYTVFCQGGIEITGTFVDYGGIDLRDEGEVIIFKDAEVTRVGFLPEVKINPRHLIYFHDADAEPKKSSQP